MKCLLINQMNRKKRYNPPIIIPPTVVSNQLGEISYFNAYLLPLSQKANLQSALNTYGAVRLEKGDYSGVAITMTSNQKLYGHPKLNLTPTITIASGSTNVHIENVIAQTITFQAGSVISNCKIKTVKYTSLVGTNISINNNEFVDIIGSIVFDCSTSGYFRNTKVIKHQVQSDQINLRLKANSTTPSYGNVHLHSNFLTPLGDATDIDGLQSLSFVGLDSEGWNLNGSGTRAMLYARNMGRINITDLGGGNGYSAVITGAYDIEAESALFYNKLLNVPAHDKISSDTNISVFKGDTAYTRTAGSPIGFDLLAHTGNNDFVYNGVTKTSLITNPTDVANIKSSFLHTQYTPWIKNTFEIIPDPTGVNWSTERIGKPDSRSYIQGLIDSNSIAELPEGIYYIGSTLNIPLDGNHGIIGKGTGKTAIVGLTDDFPLITLSYGSTQNFTLAYLTLQGGNVGIYSGITDTQIAFQNLKYVSFRNQTNAIHLRRIFGLDNNFFEHLSFINCTRGLFQDPLKPYVDTTTCSYIDKTVFYNCQFLNCQTPISMLATRPDNLNLWYNCKFDSGLTALELSGQNFPLIANCEFRNFTGTEVLKSNVFSIYNSIFENNIPSSAMINSVVTHIEGSSFLDTARMFSPVQFNVVDNYIYDSIINGNVTVLTPDGTYPASAGVYINSSLNANASINKLLVNVKTGTPVVLIDETPNPYPQLLVTQ